MHYWLLLFALQHAAVRASRAPVESQDLHCESGTCATAGAEQEGRRGRTLLQVNSHLLENVVVEHLLFDLESVSGGENGSSGALQHIRVEGGHKRTAANLKSTLGIVVASGIADVYPSGEAIPGERSVILTTSEAGQQTGRLPIVALIGGKTIDVGTLTVSKLPEGPVHVHNIKVTFELKKDSSAEPLDLGCQLDASAALVGDSETIVSDTFRLDDCTEAKLFTKKGVICKQSTGCNATHLEATKGAISWLYNYRQRISIPDSEADDVLQWANENSIEFVPMIGWRYIDKIDGERCYFTDAGGDAVPPYVAEKAEGQQCSMDDIFKTFEQLNREMTVKPTWLLGFNEPYILAKEKKQEDGSSYDPPRFENADKNISGVEAAEYWRNIVQPVAERFGYKLVSPTTAQQPPAEDYTIPCQEALCTGRSNSNTGDKPKTCGDLGKVRCGESYWMAKQEDKGFSVTAKCLWDVSNEANTKCRGEAKVQCPSDIQAFCDGDITAEVASDDNDDGLAKDKVGWLVDFLVACVARQDAEPPCDINQIKAISVHKYTAAAEHWRRFYEPSEEAADGLMRAMLKTQCKDAAPEFNWDEYFNRTPFWVTETNGNWDGPKNVGVPSEVQCQRLTGKAPEANWGEGSVEYMMKNEQIDRIVWWNLFNQRDREMTQTARMTNSDGSLTPVGAAYLHPDETECDESVIPVDGDA